MKKPLDSNTANICVKTILLLAAELIGLVKETATRRVYEPCEDDRLSEVEKKEEKKGERSEEEEEEEEREEEEEEDEKEEDEEEKEEDEEEEEEEEDEE